MPKIKKKTTSSYVLKFSFTETLNLSLTHLRAQSVCHELKGDLSPVMLFNEMFHDSLKISTFSRICLEHH